MGPTHAPLSLGTPPGPGPAYRGPYPPRRGGYGYAPGPYGYGPEGYDRYYDQYYRGGANGQFRAVPEGGDVYDGGGANSRRGGLYRRGNAAERAARRNGYY